MKQKKESYLNLLPTFTANNIMAFLHFNAVGDKHLSKGKFIAKHDLSQFDVKQLEHAIEFLIANDADAANTSIEHLMSYLIDPSYDKSTHADIDDVLRLKGLKLANEFHSIGVALITVYAIIMQGFIVSEDTGNEIDVEWYQNASSVSMGYLSKYSVICPTPFIARSIDDSYYLPSHEIELLLGAELNDTVLFDDGRSFGLKEDTTC